jgi:hypothetical protein
LKISEAIRLASAAPLLEIHVPKADISLPLGD